MREQANHGAPLAPLQGAMLAERADVMVPGHRSAQPWARVSRPVGPVNCSLDDDQDSKTMTTPPIGRVRHAPNGGRDSSPGLKEPWRRMPWVTPAHPVFIPSRPEGAREALIHP